MKQRTALQIVLVISILGLLFSGYLSYNELFAGGCTTGAITCGAKSISIFGLPACVYGFFMYLVIFVVVVLGLRSKYLDIRKM